jgi:hypothetical protein
MERAKRFLLAALCSARAGRSENNLRNLSVLKLQRALVAFSISLGRGGVFAHRASGASSGNHDYSAFLRLWNQVVCQEND